MREEQTLGNLVDLLGGSALRVMSAPLGLHLPLRGVVLQDPAESLKPAPNCLLLAVGVLPDAPDACRLAVDAAAMGYTGIVLKRRERPLATLVEAASAAGIAVLTTPDVMLWRQLDGLLLSALESRGTRNAGGELGEAESLFAIANAVAATTGGSVAIEDMERRVIAYSSVPGQRIDPLREQGILSRRVPEVEHNDWQYREVFAAEDVIHFAEIEGELARSAIAIRAGRRPLGTIWAIEGPTGMTELGRRTLRDGARLASIAVLRATDAGELQQQLKEQALRAALDGQSSEEAIDALGLNRSDQHCLIGFAPPASLADTSPAMTFLASAVARHVGVMRPDAFTAPASAAVYVLLPATESVQALRWARDTMRALSRVLDSPVCAAVSSVPTEPLRLGLARAEVDAVLRVATIERHPGVHTLDQVRAGVLINAVRDLAARDPRLAHPGIEALHAMDQERGSEFCASLLAWCESEGDARAAAELLGVHPNTLRYRIRRVADLAGIDMTDSDARLAAWIHLRMAKAPTAIGSSTSRGRRS